MNNFEYAKNRYMDLGIDVEEAMNILEGIPLSIHCWQTDDIKGFESESAVTSGGIQTTGNYPARARNFEEVTEDLKKVLSLVAGKHRISIHASYGDFKQGPVDRDKIEARHFEKWVQFAKENKIKLDFNATFFSHQASNYGTLSNPDEELRSFWINHAIACIRISEYIASELDDKVLLNIWIPDGLKDIPSDRLSPRMRLKDSLDKILSCGYDKSKVEISVESKVFGIGLESYTAGSHEFYLCYAIKNKILPLIDIGHFHPTENVADKLSSLSIFFDKIALHLTRSVRWDSDHILLFNDNLKEVCEEIIRLGYDKFLIGLDFFDANLNRIMAYVLSIRNIQKALLMALLKDNKELSQLQNSNQFTQQLILNESYNTLPFGEIWDEFCRRQDILCDEAWPKAIKEYEDKVKNER